MSPTEENSSPKLDESSPITEHQVIELPKDAMTTKETASFLGWTEDKLSSRRKREQMVEGKGYRFTTEKQNGKVIWKAEKLSMK